LFTSSGPESTIEYQDNTVSISYAAPIFIRPDLVRYQYLLEGRDEGWSEWTPETEKLYTNLMEGDYEFRVRAKDLHGQVSEEDRFAFTVLPPWYRTPWAYLIYLFGGGVVIFYGAKYRSMAIAQKAAREQAAELEKERAYTARLEIANERLRKANKLRDEFLATTSHELRTPITAILGFTNILREELPEGGSHNEFLGIIEDSGNRLMDTLNALLEVAKLRSGTLELSPERVDLGELCRTLAAPFERQAVLKGLSFSVEAEAPTPAMIDVTAIERVLNSILSNAVKFTDFGGISVRMIRGGDYASIAVSDTGVGIDESALEHVFGAFIQESDGEARDFNGTGLGLAISGGLVNLMGGSIRVESEKGAGSTFVVELPLEPSPRSGGAGVDFVARDRPASRRETQTQNAVRRGTPFGADGASSLRG
jgi:signal transduction histidine kinase